LAREVGFVERDRVISGADFVQSLILGWLQEPEITLDGLTQVLERRQVSISASGLSQRFTPDAGRTGGDRPAQTVQCRDPGR
jgi:hypothetical protein